MSLALRGVVAIAFLTLSGVVLAAVGTPGDTQLQPQDLGAERAYLIVTSQELRPAFDSLGEWIDSRGGTSLLITVEDLHRYCLGLCSPESELSYLHYTCRRNGYDSMILGGGESALGMPFRELHPAGPGDHPNILHAQVDDLGEAWAFVARCRNQGWPVEMRALEVLPAEQTTTELLLDLSPQSLLPASYPAGRKLNP